MPIVYLVAAAAGLPIVLLGQRTDRAGGGAAGPVAVARRVTGAVLLFGGLTGFALSILALQPILAAVVALAAGSAAGYLRARIMQLSADPSIPVGAVAVAGGIASVVAEVSDDTAGKILVETGGERWYVAAEPFRSGTYEMGTVVVVVALRDGVALIAAPEEVDR